MSSYTERQALAVAATRLRTITRLRAERDDARAEVDRLTRELADARTAHPRRVELVPLRLERTGTTPRPSRRPTLST